MGTKRKEPEWKQRLGRLRRLIDEIPSYTEHDLDYITTELKTAIGHLDRAIKHTINGDKV